jgi:hypothetical protein
MEALEDKETFALDSLAHSQPGECLMDSVCVECGTEIDSGIEDCECLCHQMV